MTHFLHSLGLVKVTEPFQKLVPIGVVMGEALIEKGTNKYLKPEDCVKGIQRVRILYCYCRLHSYN